MHIRIVKVSKLFRCLVVMLFYHSISQLLILIPLMDYLNNESSICISHFDNFILPTHQSWFDIRHPSYLKCPLLHFTTCFCIWKGLGNDIDSFISNHLMYPNLQNKRNKSHNHSITFLYQPIVIASNLQNRFGNSIVKVHYSHEN